MHISDAKRAADLPKDEQEKLKLPSDTHILSGTIEGHGAIALVSPDGDLDAKVIKLARTPGGGIEYQFAIFVDEPEPVKPEVPQSPEETAVAYLIAKGQSETSARAAVTRFGADRVLAAKAKDDAAANEALDAELSALVFGKPAETKEAKDASQEKKPEIVQ